MNYYLIELNELKVAQDITDHGTVIFASAKELINQYNFNHKDQKLICPVFMIIKKNDYSYKLLSGCNISILDPLGVQKGLVIPSYGIKNIFLDINKTLSDYDIGLFYSKYSIEQLNELEKFLKSLSEIGSKKIDEKVNSIEIKGRKLVRKF